MKENQVNKTYCVYKHTNKINGKSYIGSTSRKPEDRWMSGLGYKNQPFYKYILEYGWDGFTHEILATGLSFIEASNMEKDLIIKYKSLLTQNGYNARVRGLDDNEIPYSTKICEIDNHGNLIKVYDNVYQAAYFKNINDVNIYNAALNNGYSCGRIWKFLDTDLDTFINNLKLNFDVKKYDGLEPVYMYSKEGVFIREFKNAVDAGNYIYNRGIGNSSASTTILSSCRVPLSDKRCIRFTYLWRFACDIRDKSEKLDLSLMDKEFSNSKEILCFSLEKEFIKEYRNLSVLVRTTKFDGRAIRSACKLHEPCYGMLWIHKEDFNRIGYIPFKLEVKKKTPVIVIYPDRSFKIYLSERDVIKKDGIGSWEFEHILDTGKASKSGRVYETLKRNEKGEFVWNIDLRNS